MFTERLDGAMLTALRVAVKRSLAELSRAINGDAKTEVVPLFYAALELERSFGASETVELRPTLQELANMIRSVSRELLQVRPRLVARRAVLVSGRWCSTRTVWLVDALSESSVPEIRTVDKTCLCL